MVRGTRFVLAALQLPLAAAAQNPAQPTCADVAKDIDKYADQDVSFNGKIDSIEVRDGALLMIFQCLTKQGEAIPDAYFGIALAAGAAQLESIRQGPMDKGMVVTGVVRATNTTQIFNHPPDFRGPYLLAVSIKPIG